MKRLLVVILFTHILSLLGYAQSSDKALRKVTEQDLAGRDAAGKLVTISAAEHLSRGQIYFTNRQFPQSREHFQIILDNFPNDPAMSGALFMIGRSYYWERDYAKAIPYLDRAFRQFPDTKDGREGLYFDGSCNVRLGRNLEAAKIYEQYTTMYPTGERIDGAYLNVIDAYREAGKYDEADKWVAKVRQRFPKTATEATAMHAQLRMQIFREQWAAANATADTMLSDVSFFDSMTSPDEVKYLKAFALEKAGRKSDAITALLSIPSSTNSYFSGLASDKLVSYGRSARTVDSSTRDFPVWFADDILRESKKRSIDPRFILAIMKQESSFRPAVKSASAARGLLQLVFDTALKYNKQAGYADLKPDDLYDPRINIAIGCEYIADLKSEFGGLYEAIAASYNGGEDNAARWLNRSKPKEPAIFASEVGFAETKNYVFKVMTNYRIYRALYDEQLKRR